MPYKEFYSHYNQLLQEQYPAAKGLVQAVSSLPLCPFVISLSSDLFKDIQSLVRVLYRLTHSDRYKEFLQKKMIENNIQQYLDIPAPPSSVLMSYDFHITSNQELKLIEVNTHSSGYLVSELVDQVTSNQELKLIEVNTHSSGYLVSELVDQVQNVSGPGFSSKALKSLSDSFQSEWKYFANISGQPHSPERVCIVDQNIQQQKMYIEFLMYKHFFKKFLGWPSDMQDAKDLSLSGDSKGRLSNSEGKAVPMVYSRSTDFYWESQEMLPIKQAFLSKKCCVSPHPVEYFLLADKERLCDWSNETFLDSMGLSEAEKTLIQKMVSKTVPLNTFSKEELWSQRKKWFFKPTRKYGGKLVYRGKNLTRKVFDRILGTDFLCQELIVPAVFTDPEGANWKYDIRAFVYKDQVQKLTARVYQGQVTGFNVPHAGFASVVVK